MATKKIIRAALDINSAAKTLTDKLANEEIFFSRGNDVQFQCAVFRSGTLETMSSGTVYLEIKTSPDPDEVALVSKSTTTLTSDLALGHWKGDTGQHFTLDLDKDETVGIAGGRQWLVIWWSDGTEDVTLYSGYVVVKEDGADNPTEPTWEVDKLVKQSELTTTLEGYATGSKLDTEAAARAAADSAEAAARAAADSAEADARAAADSGLAADIAMLTGPIPVEVAELARWSTVAMSGFVMSGYAPGQVFQDTTQNCMVEIVSDDGSNKFRYQGLSFESKSEAEAFISLMSDRLAPRQGVLIDGVPHVIEDGGLQASVIQTGLTSKNRLERPVYVYSANGAYSSWNYERLNDDCYTIGTVAGSWLANLGSAGLPPEVRMVMPFGVIIGDSISEGHQSRHGRLSPGSSGDGSSSSYSTFDDGLGNRPGQLAWSFANAFGMHWYNHGIGGQKLYDVMPRFARDVLGETSYPDGGDDGRGHTTLPYGQKPHCAFLLCGTNDISVGRTVPEMQSGYLDFVERCIAAEIIPIVCTILPRGASSWDASEEAQRVLINAWIKRTLESYGAVVVDAGYWGLTVDADAFDHTDINHFDLRMWSGNEQTGPTHPGPVGYVSLANHIIRQIDAPVYHNGFHLHTEAEPYVENGQSTNAAGYYHRSLAAYLEYGHDAEGRVSQSQFFDLQDEERQFLPFRLRLRESGVLLDSTPETPADAFMRLALSRETLADHSRSTGRAYTGLAKITSVFGRSPMSAPVDHGESFDVETTVVGADTSVVGDSDATVDSLWGFELHNGVASLLDEIRVHSSGAATITVYIVQKTATAISDTEVMVVDRFTASVVAGENVIDGESREVPELGLILFSTDTAGGITYSSGETGRRRLRNTEGPHNIDDVFTCESFGDLDFKFSTKFRRLGA